MTNSCQVVILYILEIITVLYHVFNLFDSFIVNLQIYHLKYSDVIVSTIDCHKLAADEL